MMPAGNPYLDQFTQSLAEAAQVANQLRQAHLQQQEISNQNQQAQARQALAQQQFEQQKGQQGLANALQMNEMGASPVSAGGTVPSTLPNMAGVQQPASLPDALSGIAGHGAFQSEVPAGYGGHVVTKMPDGTSYQLPTAEEQFARALNHSGQQMQQQWNIQFPFQLAEKTAGYAPLPADTTKDLNLPEGLPVDRKDIPKYINAQTERGKLAQGLGGKDMLSIEAAARDFANRTGLKVDPSKSVFGQLPPSAKLAVIGRGEDALLGPTRKAAMNSNMATQAVNRENTTARLGEFENQQNELNPQGQKLINEISPVEQQLRDLREMLRQPDKNGVPLEKNNTPAHFLGDYAQYKLGMNPGGGGIGAKMGELNQAMIQSIIPLMAASGSRNFRMAQELKKHVPNPAFDSPANMAAKIDNMLNNFAAARTNAYKYMTKRSQTVQDLQAQDAANGVGANAAGQKVDIGNSPYGRNNQDLFNPAKVPPGTNSSLPRPPKAGATLDAGNAKQFIQAAGGDKAKARTLAKAEGWAF